MRESEYFAAVYGILENEKGKILFMQRKDTGFMDDKYGLPAGHLEGIETLKQGTIREIKEEIGINVREEDLELLHNNHRISTGDRVYFDFYFKIKKYSGDIVNNEPDKCSELRFLQKNDERIIPYLREVFQKIDGGERFSEIYIT